MAYAYGEPVTLTLTGASGTAALADYAEVVLTIIQPDGTSLTRTKTGGTLATNPYVFAPTQVGRHAYYYVTTTPNGATTPQPFDVDAAGTVALVSLADAKAQLNISNTTNDDELQTFITAASDIVEQKVGPVAPVTVTETLSARGEVLTLSYRPVISITNLSEWLGATSYALSSESPGAGTVDSYGYDLDAANGIVYRKTSGYARPWWTGTRSVTVTYKAGRTVIPAAIRMATLVLVQHLWATQRGGQGQTLPVPGADDGAQIYPGESFAIPPRVLELLEPYLHAPVIA